MLADLQGADMRRRDLPGFGHRGFQAFDLQVLDPWFSELYVNVRIIGKLCALLRGMDMLNAGVGDELRVPPSPSHHQSAEDPHSSSEQLWSPQQRTTSRKVHGNWQSLQNIGGKSMAIRNLRKKKLGGADL
ncbi:hypothetical protein GDO81_029023 [Engystomops pustulosus]|uniref:Uncharacterized protein n=1 Tax=Engystomops pustulosus TaxID=76066 RepID=A0AAV6Z577_ENGPU|nr:hypothetical protein GDO81_029023 [Engystomops pustulosus]